MPWATPYTQLPKDLNLARAAVPTGSTAVTTVDTDVAEVTVANTTGSTITLTVTDAAGNQIVNVINVAANSPVSLQFSPAEFCSGGVKWLAGGAGLVGTIRGWQRMGLTLGTATAQSNNQPIPA